MLRLIGMYISINNFLYLKVVLMKFKQIKAALLGLIFCAANASATLITLETRDINQTFDQNNLLGSWEQSTAGIANSIDSFNGVATGKKKLNMLTIDLNLKSNGTWTFEGGLDATYGAVLFVNGNLVDSRSDDLWWSNNWNNNDVFKVDNVALISGNNVVQLLWAENCCNGTSSVRFSEATGQANILTVENINGVNNINPASIPEPTSIAIFGLAIVGLVTRRKLQSK